MKLSRYAKYMASRALLVLCGLLAGFVALEAGLSLAALVFNRSPTLRQSADGQLRILCLGESTTREHYPSYLQAILDREAPELKTEVIDCGKAGTTSAGILAALPQNLDTFQPAIVITMMGINDADGHFYADSPAWLRRWRSLYFLRLLIGGFLAQRDEAACFNYPDPAEERPVPKIFKLKDCFLHIDNLDYSEPEFVRYCVRPLADFARDNGEEDILRYILDRIENNGDRPDAGLSFLAAMFIMESRTSARMDKAAAERAIKLFRARLAKVPDDIEARVNLAAAHAITGDDAEYERQMEITLDTQPQTARQYWISANEHMRRGRGAKALHMLNEADRLFPGRRDIRTALARANVHRGRYGRALDIFSSIRPHSPAEERRLRRAANLLRFVSAPDSTAAKCARRRLENQKNCINPKTRDNYQALALELKRRSVPLVAMQYPIRSVAPLKTMLGNFPDTVFIDNSGPFLDAAGKDGFGRYFTDCFAGDFGHCTDAGKKLTAKNIAKTLLPILKAAREQ